MLSGAEVKGVVQVCRKGSNPTDAGNDFGPQELQALTGIAQVLARYF
jgi:hypothetical protein